MKKCLPLLCLLLLLCLSARAENVYPSFSALLDAEYTACGWQADTVCDTLALLTRGQERTLVGAIKTDGGVRKAFENARVLDCGFPADVFMTMDTDDVLFLSYRALEGRPVSWQDDYRLTDGHWVMQSTIRYEQSTSESDCVYEYSTAVQGTQLFHEYRVLDLNDNTLMRRGYDPLPNVLTQEERYLENVDAACPPIHGATIYAHDESMLFSQDILRRLFDAMISPQNYTYVRGVNVPDGLQFLVDRADGQRVLLCMSWAEGANRSWAESAPLPKGTTLGVENFVTALNLGGIGVTVCAYGPTRWGIGEVLGDSLYQAGENWVTENGLSYGPVAIGDHALSNITKINWLAIPSSLEEARRRLDSSAWATPNNSNPADRLHLRQAPDRSAASLGKYLNGTPVQVLQKGSEWTRVRVGATEGWMMTRYLAFGSASRSVESALQAMQLVYPAAQVTWEDTSAKEMIDRSDLAQMLVIGVNGSQTILWHPRTNRVCRISQSELWNGNG